MANVLAHLLVAYLVLVAPWLSRFKYCQLQHKLAAGEVHSRIRFYQIAALQQMARVLIVLVVCLIGSIPIKALGLVAPASWNSTARVLAILLSALGASIVLFRFRGDWQLRRLLKMVGALIPLSSAERVWFAVVALGAGISEEIVFRGFLFFYLDFFTKLSSLQIVVLSSIIFGFCHLYQGWFGVLGTTFAGLCLGFLYLDAGSLFIPIVVHAALDLRVLLIMTPKRLESLKQPTKVTVAANATL